MIEFILPGGADRTTVIGMTGTGKTVFGAWLLSKQRFDKRPWVCIDFKNEELWDKIGDPPMRPLKITELPKKQGLYRLRVRPGEDDALEDWFWRVWEKENIGLFADEASLIPQKQAFKAILRQGRSKRIPVISCSQRPVDCDREIFTESNYLAVFRLKDSRDYKIVEQFSGSAKIGSPLPPHHCYWYDAHQNALFTLKPCPPPDSVAKELKAKAPYSWLFA